MPLAALQDLDDQFGDELPVGADPPGGPHRVNVKLGAVREVEAEEAIHAGDRAFFK